MLYSNILIIIFVAVIALYFSMVLQTIVYHITFILLRSVCGGYHASTQQKCFIISFTVFVLSLFGIAIISSFWIAMFFSLMSVLLIWFKAPIENENRPLSEDEREKMKISGRIMATVLIIVALITYILFKEIYNWFSISILFGMITHAFLFVIALLLESRKIKL